jgi:hypothetical protein
MGQRVSLSQERVAMSHGEPSRIVNGEYRVTRMVNGLLIETLDYHAGPVLLTAELLDELGVTFRRPEAPRRPRPPAGLEPNA